MLVLFSAFNSVVPVKPESALSKEGDDSSWSISGVEILSSLVAGCVPFKVLPLVSAMDNGALVGP